MRKLIVTLAGLWRARQRGIDKRILWPSIRDECLRLGQPLDVARSAFAMHAFRDPAWLALGAEQICAEIDALD